MLVSIVIAEDKKHKFIQAYIQVHTYARIYEYRFVNRTKNGVARPEETGVQGEGNQEKTGPSQAVRKGMYGCVGITRWMRVRMSE